MIMLVIMEAANAKPVYFDLSTPRSRFMTDEHQRLAELQPGEELIHDHSNYKTLMTVWIAQQRQRREKNYQYERISRPGQKITKYRIWLDRKNRPPNLRQLTCSVEALDLRELG